MNILSRVPEKYKLVVKIAAPILAMLLLSWVAGQRQKWSTPKPTKTTIDAGTPIAGPVSQAPTVTVEPQIAVPDLSLDELKAEAKKYGMVLSLPAKGTKKPAEAPAGAAGAPQPATEAPAQVWPMFLGEESFKHAPSNADVDVSAWLPGFGQRVDLRASWRPWVPPAAAPVPKQVVCQSGSFFANEAKWYGSVGYGLVAGSGGVGLGPSGDLGYKGPRTGLVTWGAGGHGAYSGVTGFQGDAAFRLTF